MLWLAMFIKINVTMWAGGGLWQLRLLRRRAEPARKQGWHPIQCACARAEDCRCARQGPLGQVFLLHT